MKKRLLSILLTACMVFSAGQPAVYAANESDQAEENAILSEDGETQQPIEDIQEEGGTEETAAPVSEDIPAPEIVRTDLDENLVGNDFILEERADNKNDFLNKYRSLLVQRADNFRVTVPLEAKMTTIDQYKPSSVVFNDQDFDSWESSSCFETGYSDRCYYFGSEEKEDGLLMNLTGVVSSHYYDGHSDQQNIIVNFPEKLPDGINIEIDGKPAELNEDRTAARTLGNYPTETLETVPIDISIKFVGLYKSDIMDETPIMFNQWLLTTKDVYVHNGVPNEGDYLYHHLDGLPDINVQDPVVTSFDEATHTYYYDQSVDVTANYYSTGEMEEEVLVEIDRVLGELDLTDKSEYERIKAIHDYICWNTEYQYPQDGDSPPMLKHSAYSALISKRAVCDGYANLFYRMCLRAGIDARIVYGQGSGDSHAWNIVRLGSLYYDVDCTWDAKSSHDYFLMGHSEFLNNHTPKQEFTEPAFLETYPMSDTRYSPPTFETASLILGGKIGLNMMVNLPDIPEFDYDNSYVEFTVNGGEPIRQDYDPNRTNRDGSLFKFTCYVNAVQMADDITAVFHYLDNGEDKQVSQTYTIEQYLRTLSVWKDATDEAKELAKATADYGYHVQPYLAEVNNWELEGENAAHKRMSFGPTAGYINKLTEILNDLSFPSVKKTSDISSLGISLLLDSDTSLKLFIYTDADYTGTVQATVDNEGVAAKKVAEGKYRIVIPNIGASNLNKNYKVVVTTDAGDTTVNLSALNYVKIALSKTDPEATYNEKQSMGAIYYYSKAAEAYAATQSNA